MLNDLQIQKIETIGKELAFDIFWLIQEREEWKEKLKENSSLSYNEGIERKLKRINKDIEKNKKKLEKDLLEIT